MLKNIADFYSKQRIEEDFGVSQSTINHLIKTKRFPSSDYVDGRTHYWHRITLGHFLTVYNRVQAGKTRYTIDYSKRRKELVSQAKSFISKHNIMTPFQYRERQIEAGTMAPTPATLFCYSIIFEELVGAEFIADNTCVQILNNLREKRTVKELAMIIGTTERTVYRKLKVLRESGYEVKGDANGIWI